MKQYKNNPTIFLCSLVVLCSNLMIPSYGFSETYDFVSTWGRGPIDNGQFYEPHGVAVDSSGNLYVADRYNQRIQKFDSNGDFVTA